jgi:hypothetical protein
MTTSPAICWNAGRFIGVIIRGDARVRRSTRQCCRGVERIRVSRRAATFFPLAASYPFCGDRGPGRGVGGARRGLRHEGAVQEGERGEGNKRKRESCWKSGGGRTCLYTWRRTGLADEVGSDTIPDTAGGEVVTGPLNRKA